MIAIRPDQLPVNRGTPHTASRYALDAPQQNRCGFSLIEVILATALLLGSAIVLSRLAGMGRSRLAKTQQSAAAQQMCEQTLNEIVLGLRSPEPVDSAPLLPAEMPTSDVPPDPARRRASITRDSSFRKPTNRRRSEFSLRERSADARLSGAAPSVAWLHSIAVQDHPQVAGLRAMTVTVQAARSDLTRPVPFSLTRWIHRPNTSLQQNASITSSPRFGNDSFGGNR